MLNLLIYYFTNSIMYYIKVLCACYENYTTVPFNKNIFLKADIFWFPVYESEIIKCLVFL